MRTARVKAEGAGYYHCLSRVVDRRMVMGPEQKEKFRKLMRAVEGFSGVQVLTYAVMSNHFHILVHVPERKEISDSELIARLRLLYPKVFVDEVARLLAKAVAEKNETYVQTVRNRYLYRMYDVSQFMKTLKQRFSTWYNRGCERKGTLWEERFKSILVEGRENALLTMAAYIDLNPVRAGIVRDPKDYRYSGYGEAVGGSSLARKGLGGVMVSQGADPVWGQVSHAYRRILYAEGLQRRSSSGTVVRCGFMAEEVQKVLDEGGQLALRDVLRCRVRYLSDGVAMGSKAFVNEVFERYRGEFGVKRRDGARKMKWGAWGELCTMRDLRMEVVTVPEVAAG